MMRSTWFVTATDTGVGKTVLTVLLARYLVAEAQPVKGMKPFASGDRKDARALRSALESRLSLAELNPWYFRRPLAPLLAARAEERTVRLDEVLKRITSLRQPGEIFLMEGAGGFLTPLGEDFSAREIVMALPAIPILVAPNRLGAINQVLMTLASVPPLIRTRFRVVLVAPARESLATRTNPQAIEEFVGRRVYRMPRINDPLEIPVGNFRPWIKPLVESLLGT